MTPNELSDKPQLWECGFCCCCRCCTRPIVNATFTQRRTVDIYTHTHTLSLTHTNKYTWLRHTIETTTYRGSFPAPVALHHRRGGGDHSPAHRAFPERTKRESTHQNNQNNHR